MIAEGILMLHADFGTLTKILRIASKPRLHRKFTLRYIAFIEIIAFMGKSNSRLQGINDFCFFERASHFLEDTSQIPIGPISGCILSASTLCFMVIVLRTHIAH